MSKSRSPIRMLVDLTNPGQYFACCGLLELADRLWPGAEGWFDSGTFYVACDGTLVKLLDAVADCDLTSTMSPNRRARLDEMPKRSGARGKFAPGTEAEYKTPGTSSRDAAVVLKDPFDITIDWYLDDFAGGSRFKTWAGKQSALSISAAMHDAWKSAAKLNEDCLSYAVTNCGLPFNFDSDLGGQGKAVDIGFSIDSLAASRLTRIETTACPVLELSAFIGLQRFRPREIGGQNSFLYAAWGRPLPVPVAAPAACGAPVQAGMNRFKFRMLRRTQYHKSFLPAIRQHGDFG
ncbi:MAG: type I-U CRISPR-associated protein Cas8c [Pirellula sp.]|nr:type I-U CRISPR-associated protein Cas8c [Pirellula sp.]